MPATGAADNIVRDRYGRKRTTVNEARGTTQPVCHGCDDGNMSVGIRVWYADGDTDTGASLQLAETGRGIECSVCRTRAWAMATSGLSCRSAR